MTKLLILKTFLFFFISNFFCYTQYWQQKIDYKIIVADMHLSSFFGKTINEIKNYSKKLIILDKIKTKDTISNRLSVISKTIQNLSKIFEKKKPTFLFLIGDRAEVLGAAIAAMHFNIPIIHLYGGDLTQGGTDESTRHAISKIANLHLTSNFRSLKNIQQMGEESWRIHNVGLSSLDLFRNGFFKPKSYIEKKFNIDLSKRSKHNALLDCELLREVYINLLDVKEPKFDLSNNIEAQRLNKTKDYNKTIVKISEDEFKKHKDFLKSELRKNFY